MQCTKSRIAIRLKVTGSTRYASILSLTYADGYPIEPRGDTHFVRVANESLAKNLSQRLHPCVLLQYPKINYAYKNVPFYELNTIWHSLHSLQ
jgi:hypothetical protein